MTDAAPFPLAERTIFVCLAGSQAHGTAREGSDVDLRGVCVAPLALRLSLQQRFEQHEGPLDARLAAEILPRLRAHPSARHGLAQKLECVIYDVAKLLSLCAAANPTALELLFADAQDWVLATPRWRRLHDERQRFLTRKVQQTYLGYALAQLKRIRTHRAWLLSPPPRKPTRADFGLPDAGTLSRDDQQRIEQALAEKVRAYGVDDVDLPKHARIALQQRLAAFWADALGATPAELDERVRALAGCALDLPRAVAATLNAERRYRAALKHWESYQTWKAQRNPARAALERRHGYDTKHAMHLVRLMRIGLEVLREGALRVRRPDADELLAIRDGALDFEALEALAAALQAEMQQAARASALPAEVDPAFVDALAYELMTERL